MLATARSAPRSWSVGARFSAWRSRPHPSWPLSRIRGGYVRTALDGDFPGLRSAKCVRHNIWPTRSDMLVRAALLEERSAASVMRSRTFRQLYTRAGCEGGGRSVFTLERGETIDIVASRAAARASPRCPHAAGPVRGRITAVRCPGSARLCIWRAREGATSAATAWRDLQEP